MSSVLTCQTFPSSVSSGGASLLSNIGLERIKGLAIISMVVDHLVRVAHLHELTAWPEAVMVCAGGFGRLAFPLFVLLIAARLAEQPDRWRGYAGRLAAWTLVAQPAYVAAFETTWWDLNVFSSLLIVVLGVPVGRLAAGSDVHRITAVFVGLCLLMAAAFVTFGMIGVVAGWVTMLALAWIRSSTPEAPACHVPYAPCDVSCRRTHCPQARAHDEHHAERVLVVTAACAGMICVVANLDYVEAGVPMSAWGALTALTVALAGLPASPRAISPRRVPGWIFYAFYPAHLLAMTTLRWML